jgi:hypothetical protein
MDIVEVAARDDMNQASGSFQSRCARRFDARFQFWLHGAPSFAVSISRARSKAWAGISSSRAMTSTQAPIVDNDPAALYLRLFNRNLIPATDASPEL